MRTRPRSFVAPSSSRPRIPNRLWYYRKRLGYSQKRIARLLGHRQTSHVSDYERGKRLPTLDTALKLELILRVPAAFLYEDRYKALKHEIRHAEEYWKSLHP